MWSLRRAEADVIGEVQAVDGEILSLAIVATKTDSAAIVEHGPLTETDGPVVRVSAKSLLSDWEHVDRIRAGFWRRYRPVP